MARYDVLDSRTSTGLILNKDSMFVSSGGTANNTTVNSGGSFHILKGGVGSDTTVNSGGTLTVFRYGAAYGIVENGGFVDLRKDVEATFAANAFSGLVLSKASASLHSGTTANSTSVSNNGFLHVFSGGIANSTTIKNGWLYVSSGGIANHVEVNSYGCMWIYSCGFADDITINAGGSAYVSSGGTANNIAINGSGSMFVFSGGTANNIAINSSGSVFISSGGTANNIAINSNGSMCISSGALTENTRINNYGSVFISSGGTAHGTIVTGSGFFCVSSGGTATGIKEDGGYVHVEDGAEVSFLSNMFSGIALDGQSATVHSGTTAVSVTVNSGGSMNVFFGGIANNVKVTSGGSMAVNCGGIANHVEFSSGGSMGIGSGGEANDIAVSSGGALMIDCGGMLASAAILSGGRISGYYDCSDISFESGAILDFSLACYDPEKTDALVKNLSSVQNGPVFTVTLGEGQGEGTYKLADGVSDFKETISIFTSGTQIGSLSLDQAVTIRGASFTLSLNDGDLMLDIEAENPNAQYVYLDFDGENDMLYRNSDLDLSISATVRNPFFTEAQQQAIINELSEKYQDKDVVFLLTRPEIVPYSTLYFGLSSDFSDYGDYFGVAEGYDGNNQDNRDNAFIFLDKTYSTGQVVSVASHMLDQLMGFSYFVDGNQELGKYAENKTLLSLSSGWDQHDPYNKYCPIDPETGYRCLTGCTNTAASQIIYYWMEKGMLDFTLSLEDSDAHVSNSNRNIVIENTDDPVNGHLSFHKVNNLLSNFVMGDEDCIAALCFAAGVLQNASYGPGTTWSWWKERLFTRSGFENTVTFRYMPSVNWPAVSDSYQGAYLRLSDDDFLVRELLQGRPVGITIRSQDHCLVLDGYDSSRNMFHLNYGWGESSNEWVTLQEMVDLRVDEAIYGITPIVYADLTINDLTASDETVNLNEDVTLSFTVSNEGKEVSKAAAAYVYCGDMLLGELGLQYISPGYSRKCSLTVNAAQLPLGENDLRVEMESQNGGGISVSSVTIDHSDNAAPRQPVVAADVSELTNADVLVSAGFSRIATTQEYSFDGETWFAYDGPVRVVENGTVFFRCTDEDGNVSEVTSCEVNNIDKTPPGKPVASADVVAVTNGDVLVSAVFSEDSVTKEYSLDGKRWQAYTGAVKFRENGTAFFRGLDEVGNVSEVTEYAVTNIDKIPPEKPVASADVITATNGDVLVSAVFSEDSAVKEYSLDGEQWQAYTGAIKFSENGTVFFRAMDEVGNVSEVTEYAVTNIDKIPPEKPVASADVITATNGDVLVSAVFSEDSAVNEYSLDGEQWQAYPDAIKFSENGTAFFRAMDEVGNVSEVTEYAVTNIDKIPPEKPVASADVITATNGDVLVSAVFSEDSVVKEYSLDGENWQAYTDAVKFTENGTAFFRAMDEVGNVSEVTEYAVTNIDKTPPEKPVASADVITATNGDVLVSAVFSEDSAVKEYSLDGEEWQAYPDAIKFTENGTAFFRAMDEVGNVSEVTEYAVTNIDKTPPEKPVASADVITATNGDVLVSALFSEDSVVKEYSLDGENWQAYTDAIMFTENGTVFFRGTDAVGNVSEVVSYTVDNIIIPDNKPDNGWNDYLYDRKNGWNANLDEFVVNVVEANGEIDLDVPGTIDLESKHNLFGYDGTNMDTGDVAKIKVDSAVRLTFSIDSTAAGSFYVYEVGLDKKGGRVQLQVANVSVKANATAALKDICLVPGGSYYVAMVAKNVKKAGTEGLYNVSVTSSTFFVDADDGWNNAAMKRGVEETPAFVERGIVDIILDDNVTCGGTFHNFVGFGDSIDYAKLELPSSASLSFKVTADGNAKFTVWKRDTVKGKMTKVGPVTTLKTKGGAVVTKTTKAQFLEATNKYEYFISLESTDAAKGGEAYYNVEIDTVGSRFFDSADNGRNNVLYDKKAKSFKDDANFVATVIAAGSQRVQLDSNMAGPDGYDNFVGYQDAADCAKIVLAEKGALSFRIAALADVAFEIWQKGKDKKGSDVLNSLQKKTEVKVKDNTIGASATTAALTLDAGEYYISVSAKKTTANEKGSAFYNVTANFTAAVNDAQLDSAVAAAGCITGIESFQNGKSAWQAILA